MDSILTEKVSLQQLTLMTVAVPQRESFQSAIGVRNERRALFVRWTDRDGNWGVGESSCRPDPYFNGEYVSGAVDVIESFIFPRLPAEGSIAEIMAILAKVRNWPFTTAAVLDAVFDLRRRQQQPDLIDDWPGEHLRNVPVGISLGLFDTAEAAVARVSAAVSEGYPRVKLKVSPGMNVETVAAIREAFPDLYLGFDANGSLSENDWALLKALAEHRPAMLEQPFAPRRIDLCQALKQERPELRICLDESITDIGDVISAHQMQALDEVNIKPGRVGGMPTALKILKYCKNHDIPCWVGGMFETGVGRQLNLRLAACMPNATAHDLSPSSRYFIHDIIQNPFEMDTSGRIDLGDAAPVALDEARIREYQISEKILNTSRQ